MSLSSKVDVLKKWLTQIVCVLNDHQISIKFSSISRNQALQNFSCSHAGGSCCPNSSLPVSTYPQCSVLSLVASHNRVTALFTLQDLHPGQVQILSPALCLLSDSDASAHLSDRVFERSTKSGLMLMCLWSGALICHFQKLSARGNQG